MNDQFKTLQMQFLRYCWGAVNDTIKELDAKQITKG